jgi:hypothetical protein
MRTLSIALLGTMLLAPLGCNNNDAGEVGPASTGADMGIALIRIAHLSPNKPPIDVCLAPHGSGRFTGPILKPAGIPPNGLAYSQVSKYLSIGAGQYDVRIVDGGATTCAQSLFDATTLPTFSAGGSFTIVGTGFIPPNPGDPKAYTIAVYSEDTNSTDDGILLRFIHSAPDVPSLDFGAGSGANFTVLFSDVSYLKIGTSVSPPADANGYITLQAATPPVTYGLRLHGSNTDLLTVSSNVGLPNRTIATVFAIGDLTGMPKPLQTLICIDNAPPSGAFSACATLP